MIEPVWAKNIGTRDGLRDLRVDHSSSLEGGKGRADQGPCEAVCSAVAVETIGRVAAGLKYLCAVCFLLYSTASASNTLRSDSDHLPACHMHTHAPPLATKFDTVFLLQSLIGAVPDLANAALCDLDQAELIPDTSRPTIRPLCPS